MTNGAWWIWSIIDPEWNKAGRCMIGAISAPKELPIAFKNLTQKLGKTPKDLRVGIFIDGKGAKELHPTKLV